MILSTLALLMIRITTTAALLRDASLRFWRVPPLLLLLVSTTTAADDMRVQQAGLGPDYLYAHDRSNEKDDHDDPRGYYDYDSYPDYCSTPQQLEQRRIVPPFLVQQPRSSSSSSDDDEDALASLELVHVTIVSRHGARAPKGKPNECWWSDNNNIVGDNDDLDGKAPRSVVQWDCDDVTNTVVAGLSSSTTATLTQDSKMKTLPLFYLEKLYNGLSPSSSSSSREQSGDNEDAADDDTSNILHGTCQVAQLLRKGYEQHVWNGRMLRETYFYDNTENKNRTILQFLQYNDDDPNRFLVFRSDDLQRTLASGQALLWGMLGEITSNNNNSSIPGGSSTTRTSGTIHVLPVHTADKSRDILSDNDDLCPKLKELKDKAYDSKEYRKKLEKTYHLKATESWMKERLGYALKHPLSCLMSTVCNDLTFPDTVDELNIIKYNNNKRHVKKNKKKSSRSSRSDDADDDATTTDPHEMFQRLVNYDLVRKNFVYSYDHSAYAKLAMGPLWLEIVQNLRQCLVHGSSNNNSTTTTPALPRMVYYSGHDSTISQLLASLGSKVWRETDYVPYASLAVLEVFQQQRHNDHDDDDDNNNDDDDDWGAVSSSYKFRLLFNGRVLTSTIKHCHDDEELCDLQILLDRVQDFATNARDCERKKKKEKKAKKKDQKENDETEEEIEDEAEVEVEKTSNATTSTSMAKQPRSADLYNPNSLWFKFLLSVLGFAVGSIATWNYLHSSPFSYSAWHFLD